MNALMAAVASQVDRWAGEVDYAARHMGCRYAVSVLVGVGSLWGPFAEKLAAEAYLAGVWRRIGVSAGQERVL